MADEILNMTQVTDSLNRTLLSSIEPLVAIFQIVGIALLVYIIFLIIKAMFRWKTMSRIVKMSKSVDSLNKKMDILIEKLDNKKSKDNNKKRKKGKNKSLL